MLVGLPAPRQTPLAAAAEAIWLRAHLKGEPTVASLARPSGRQVSSAPSRGQSLDGARILDLSHAPAPPTLLARAARRTAYFVHRGSGVVERWLCSSG